MGGKKGAEPMYQPTREGGQAEGLQAEDLQVERQGEGV